MFFTVESVLPLSAHNLHFTNMFLSSTRKVLRPKPVFGTALQGCKETQCDVDTEAGEEEAVVHQLYPTQPELIFLIGKMNFTFLSPHPHAAAQRGEVRQFYISAI